MEYFEEDSFDFDFGSQRSDEGLLPYREEDWELAAEPQQSLPCLEPDDAPREHLDPYSQQQLASYYHNPLLEKGDAYADQFLETSSEYHPQFQLLLRTLQQSIHHVEDLQQKNEECSIHIQNLCQKVFDTGTGEAKAEAYCQDQRRVHGTHSFYTCKFNEAVAAKLKVAIVEGQRVGLDESSLAIYSLTLARLQCDQLIYEVASTARRHTETLANNADTVSTNVLVKLVEESIDDIRRCLNTAFSFMRREEASADGQFLIFLRKWISQLVSLLYDMTKGGSLQNLIDEEIFVLNHIVRSPPGTQGWADRLVQISTPQVTSDLWESRIYLDNVIYMLFLILRAPKGRDEFLATLRSSNSISMLKHEDSDPDWTVLDQGDDMRGVGSKWHVLPHESDLVSLYRQVPFETVLSRIFSLILDERQTYLHETSQISSDRFLQTLACCDIMCEVLGEGLATLGVSKYKQLVRRIAQTLRNIVLLMSEHWAIFKENAENEPKRHFFERMQVEYDEFVKRCVERFLTVAKLGVYQFLADLPFESVSQKAAETLYVLLNVPAGSRAEVDQLSKTAYSRQEWLDFVEDPDTKLAFEDQLSCMPENEVVYLLTTFCNLAQARPTSESHLVNIIVMDVFRVSFVYASTRDICSKMGRELLCAVASMHPYIISTILQYLAARMSEITSTIFYVISDLPFYKWTPTRQDFSLLKSWILENPVTSVPTKMVQMILKGMNWGFGDNGALFLPHNLHYEVGMMLIEVCHQYEVEKQQSGLIVKSIDHVSKVASAMRSSLTIDESFIVWTWDILLQLKLHRSQLNVVSTEKYKVAQVVDINEDGFLPKYNNYGIAQSHYVTLMGTNAGHSMTMFLQAGLPLLKKLSENGHRVPVVQCVACVTPMFIQTDIDLSINMGFISVLHDILAPADTGILSGITSKLVEHQPDVPLHVALLLGAIGTEVANEDSTLIVTYWLKIALAIPHWWENANSKSLVDFLLKSAFYQGQHCLEMCKAILYERHVDLVLHTPKNNPSPTHQNHSVISSILSFVSGGNSNGAPSFLRELGAAHTYLAYFVLDAEMRYEDDSKLWGTLLALIKSNNPESHLKKASSQVKLTHTPQAGQLSIYRWGQLVTKTPSDHPLLPAICQKFFLRYIYIAPGLGCSLGPRFFATSQPAFLFKKIKDKLVEVSNLEIQTSDTELAARMTKIFNAFVVWIDEEKLHDDNLYLPSLPSRYEPRLLATVRTKDDTLWAEFINFVAINQDLEVTGARWSSFHKVEVKPFPSHSSSMSIHTTSCQRITHLLHQFESPLTLPPLCNEISSLVATDNLKNLTGNQQVTEEIDQDLKTISSNAQVFRDVKKKLDVLNVSYLAQLPDLYSMEDKKLLMSIECQSAYSSSHKCTGGAHVELRFVEKTLNEGVSEKLKINRESSREIVDSLTNMDGAGELSYTALHLINVAQALIKTATSPINSSKNENIYDVGAKLFYTLADMNSDERWDCPATHHLLTTCLDMLGQIFICGRSNQAVPLLEQMLKRPEMAALLSAHFSPAKSCEVTFREGGVTQYDTATFVEMYEKVLGAASGEVMNRSSDVIFVLITKFDVEEWVAKYSPLSEDILRLLQAIITGLTTYGVQISTPSTPEHEKLFFRSPSSHSHLSSSAVQEIFTTHLCVIIRNAASIVFFDALKLLLDASEDSTLDASVWDALVSTAFMKSPPNGVNYTTDLACLPNYDCIDKCIKYTALFFHDKRKISASNMYTKWGPYVQPISKLLYELCVSEVEVCGATHGVAFDHFNDVIVPLFAAWLEPCFGENSDGMIWPWTEKEQKLASHMLSAFSAVLNVLCKESTTDLVSFVGSCWRFYARNVIVSYGVLAPSYVCSSYQTALSFLPWGKFAPNITDQDLMVQLCDSKLECSVHFLCHIVPDIDWKSIIWTCSAGKSDDGSRLWTEYAPEVLCRLLHILFVLASQKDRLNSYPKLYSLFVSLCDLPWGLISYQQLDYLANLVSDRYGAFCLRGESPDGKKDPRSVVLRLLRLVSGFQTLGGAGENPLYGDKLQNEIGVDKELIWMKRQSYVACTGRMIRKCSKQQDPKRMGALEGLVSLVTAETLENLMAAVDAELEINEHLLNIVYSEIWRSFNSLPSKLQDAMKNQVFVFLDRENNLKTKVLAQNGGRKSFFARYDLVLFSIMSSAYDIITSAPQLASVLEHCLDICLSVLDENSVDSTSLEKNVAVLHGNEPRTALPVLENGIDSDSVACGPREGNEPSDSAPAEECSTKLSKNEPSAALLWHKLCSIMRHGPRVTQLGLIDACTSKDCLTTLAAMFWSSCMNENDGNRVSSINESSLSLACWLSSLLPKPETEPKLIFLLGCFLQACEFLRRTAKARPDSDVNLCSVADVLSGILPLLEQWSLDRVKTGFFGNFGIARGSPLSLKFRTSVRCVMTYVRHVVSTINPSDTERGKDGHEALEVLRNLPIENRAYAVEAEKIRDFCLLIFECSAKQTCAGSLDVMKAILFNFFESHKSYFVVLLLNDLCSTV